jgi:glucose/arabinose dehydrogenase
MGALLRFAIATSLVAVVACDRNQPPSSPPPGTSGETVSGNERLGWVQPAESVFDLAVYQYAAYVDGTRRVLQAVLCTPTSVTAADCTAALPTLAAGRHTLQVAAFFMSGDTVIEGPRSSSLDVTLAGSVASAGAAYPESGSLVSSDGLRLIADVLARDLDEPRDLAVDPDNRVFVAMRDGVRIVDATAAARADTAESPAWMRDEPQGMLVSLALAADFARSRLVYVGYTTLDGDQPVIRVARYREAGGQLGEGAIVTSQPVDSLETSSVMRFAPDGTIYLGIAAGFNPDDAQRLASPAGKILRLHPDGSTPDDNPSHSPVFSYGHREPRGFAWHSSGTAWEAERGEPDDEMNVLHGGGNYGWPNAPATGGNTLPRWTPARIPLAAGTRASGLATIGLPSHPLFGDLIVSAEGTEDLVRIRLTADGQRARGLPAFLLQGRFGRIAQVTTGTDGAIYFVTANRDTWGAGTDVLVRLRLE